MFLPPVLISPMIAGAGVVFDFGTSASGIDGSSPLHGRRASLAHSYATPETCREPGSIT